MSIFLPCFVYLTRKGGDIVFLVDGDIPCVLYFYLYIWDIYIANSFSDFSSYLTENIIKRYHIMYIRGLNFNSGNYLFTTDTK